MTVPCKDCQEREVGCHTWCRKYIAFRADRDRKLEQERMEKRPQETIYKAYCRKLRRRKKSGYVTREDRI